MLIRIQRMGDELKLVFPIEIPIGNESTFGQVNQIAPTLGIRIIRDLPERDIDMDGVAYLATLAAEQGYKQLAVPVFNPKIFRNRVDHARQVLFPCPGTPGRPCGGPLLKGVIESWLIPVVNDMHSIVHHRATGRHTAIYQVNYSDRLQWAVTAAQAGERIRARSESMLCLGISMLYGFGKADSVGIYMPTQPIRE